MWKAVLNASPSASNPLELIRIVRRIFFASAPNTSGNLVVDKAPDAVSILPITQFNSYPARGMYPVPVTGGEMLYELNNTLGCVGLYWEIGICGVRGDVTTICGNVAQNYSEVVIANIVTNAINIFPGCLMDGC